MIRLYLLFCLFLFGSMLSAQSLWSDVPQNATLPAGERRIVPEQYRLVRFNLATLQSLLATAPERFGSAANGAEIILEAPMPDGSSARFRLEESPVMAPDLQTRYPETRCYTGRGIDHPSAMLKCDLTPWGFHAMVRTDGANTVFIDPYAQGNTEFYVVYFKKDYRPSKDDALFTCDTQDDDWQAIDPAGDGQTPEYQGDCMLRRYRLALACTGEYAAFHGGTKPLVMAAMNTSMNRINGVFENEFAVTMQLVPNNDTLIYLVAASDPYTNNNGSTMLGQNVTTCNARIGLANYDMGHVFSTGGGGIAGLGVICTNSKARGVTGSGSPVGDPFDIDYVVHEMGHQFDAEHTQNNNCNRVAGSSMEPGSASSIMGYAGICSPNVQTHSDDYLHAVSMQQINAFITSGSGNGCPVKINTGNSNPTVSGGADFTIPKSTYFALTATGSDPQNDVLTYCWEQMDPEFATMPPVSTSAGGPLFRTFEGTTSPTRYFPRLSDIVNNANPTWEKLPAVARTLKFRVTARDNNPVGGCTEEDDVVVTVAANAGPFQITAPNTNVSWFVGQQKTVSWSVNGTDLVPVNCANVRILLSTDGGFTYPVVLLSSAPNTGTAQVQVPNNVSNACRIKVEGLGNIFFDISNQNFIILLPPMPTFTMTPTPDNLEVCAGNEATFDLSLVGLGGFTGTVQLSASGLPPGASVDISPNPVTPDAGTTVLISGLTPAMAGVYTIAVQGTSDTLTQTALVQMTVFPGQPSGLATALNPADGASAVNVFAPLQWSAVAYAQTYLVTVATNPGFVPGSVVFSQTLSDTSILAPGLQSSTVYYWQVQALNNCGAGNLSSAFSFQTAGEDCDHVFSSSDVPKVISPDVAGTTYSSLTIPDNAVIADVNVHLTASHSYVGDLSAKLITPTSQEIALFDQPGAPETDFGCPNENLDLVFDDAAVLTATDLENTCDPTGIALQGAFKPIGVLSVLNGQNIGGNWQIAVTDNAVDDGGEITAWSLSVCYPALISPGSFIVHAPLSVSIGGNGAVTDAYLALNLSGTAAQGVFTLLALPQHGILSLSGAPLAVGGAFTQADLNAGILVYTHNGDNALSDDFHFDALDQNNAAWIHNAVFDILIIQNNLAATAVQTKDVSCTNGADGEITVSASGMDGQYQYSLNGGLPQNSAVFGGLAPGTYTVVVSGQYGYTVSSNAVTIGNPVPVVASTSVAVDAVTVTASGGAGGYEYSLDGVNFQPGNLFENLANGVYTMTVRDANGCTATAEAIVAVNTLLVTAAVGDPVLCAGGNSGSIFVNVGGGQAPFTYSLNGGAFQDENIFAGLPAGTYTVTVLDNVGFQAVTNQVTLVDPPAILLSAGVSLGTITASASGGTGALQYRLDGQNFQANPVFPNLPNGVYTVTARDANGCTVSIQVTIDVPALGLSASQTQAILCFGNSTGAITLTAFGGIPPYLFRLDAGPYTSGNVFGGLQAGFYTFTVIDVIGTETSLSVMVDEPASLEASVAVTNNDATVTVTGGTAPFTYLLDGLPVTSFENLAPGTYSLLVTDANGCVTGVVFEISANPILPTFSSISPVSCAGESDGSATLCVSGGYAPLTVSASPNLGIQTITLGTPCAFNVAFDQLPPGMYLVTITDAEGFSTEASFLVNEPPALTASASTNANSITVTASGGSGALQYSLDGVNFQSSSTFSGLQNGTYTATVQDANGCTTTVENIVVQTIRTVEAGTAWGLSVSPNPGSGRFVLNMQQAPAYLEAALYDVAGRFLRDWRLEAGGKEFSTVLDLQDLPQGVYVLRLTDGTHWGGVRLSVVR